MTKRLNSKHKVDRRLKVNLWGRPKSPFNTRAYGPGQHGQSKSSKPSDYGIQLHAKQKLKSIGKHTSSMWLISSGNLKIAKRSVILFL